MQQPILIPWDQKGRYITKCGNVWEEKDGEWIKFEVITSTQEYELSRPVKVEYPHIVIGIEKKYYREIHKIMEDVFMKDHPSQAVYYKNIKVNDCFKNKDWNDIFRLEDIDNFTEQVLKAASLTDAWKEPLRKYFIEKNEKGTLEDDVSWEDGAYFMASLLKISHREMLTPHVHHMDNDKQNNSLTNLIRLLPPVHKLIHFLGNEKNRWGKLLDYKYFYEARIEDIGIEGEDFCDFNLKKDFIRITFVDKKDKSIHYDYLDHKELIEKYFAMRSPWHRFNFRALLLIFDFLTGSLGYLSFKDKFKKSIDSSFSNSSRADEKNFEIRISKSAEEEGLDIQYSVYDLTKSVRILKKWDDFEAVTVRNQ